MAFDMFLKVDGIPGESTDTKHKDQIRVLAWSWGASQSGTMHIGAGGGAGKANFQDLSLTKYLEMSSPLLLQACATGQHIDKIELFVRKAGGKDSALTYLTITFEECLITSYSTGGSGGEDLLTENISINFAKYGVAYALQTGKGAGSGSVTTSFNIPGNTLK